MRRPWARRRPHVPLEMPLQRVELHHSVDYSPPPRPRRFVVRMGISGQYLGQTLCLLNESTYFNLPGNGMMPPTQIEFSISPDD